MSGYFITFEGVEGSGKSTVIGLIAERFEKAGVEVLVTREPGGTSISESVRNILLDPSNEEISGKTELFLYLASRAQLVHEVIRPAIESGRTVLCDRFFDATTSYQGWARGIGEKRIAELNRIAVGDTVPDATYILDLPVEEGFRRGPERREATGTGAMDRLERESLDFHRMVREGYLRIAAREPERVTVIDASRDIQSVIFDISGNIKARFGVDIL